MPQRTCRSLQQLKARAGTFGFADMLNRLDVALDESLSGASALRLRQRILAQHPVALIDEFRTRPRCSCHLRSPVPHRRRRCVAGLF
jgi:hypothetical protein